MSEDRDREDDPLVDIWATNYEQQCLQQIESEPDFEVQLQSERDLANQKVWYMFQNTATSIAQLYKGIIIDNYLLHTITQGHDFFLKNVDPNECHIFTSALLVIDLLIFMYCF